MMTIFPFHGPIYFQNVLEVASDKGLIYNRTLKDKSVNNR